MEFGAEINITCRSYSVPKLLVPNIDCPVHFMSPGFITRCPSLGHALIDFDETFWIFRFHSKQVQRRFFDFRSNRKWANFSITGSSNALEFDSLSIKNIFELPVHAKLLTSALKLETGVENIVLQQFSVKSIMSHNLWPVPIHDSKSKLLSDKRLIVKSNVFVKFIIGQLPNVESTTNQNTFHVVNRFRFILLRKPLLLMTSSKH